MPWDTLPPDGSTQLVGSPGCGKTVVGMKAHDSIPECSIFINTREKRFSRGPYVRRLDDEAIKIFNSWGKLVVDTRDESEVLRILEYFEGNWDVESNGKLRIWVDETDYFATCRSKDTVVEHLFSKLRNDGILGVCMVQTIRGQVSATIRKCCHARFIFTLDAGEFEDYARLYGLPENAPMFHYYRFELGSLWKVSPSGTFPDITYTEEPVYIAKDHFSGAGEAGGESDEEVGEAPEDGDESEK